MNGWVLSIRAMDFQEVPFSMGFFDGIEPFYTAAFSAKIVRSLFMKIFPHNRSRTRGIHDCKQRSIAFWASSIRIELSRHLNNYCSACERNQARPVPVLANEASVARFEQLFPSLFGLSILGTFAAVQLASGPSAGLMPFDFDWQFAAVQPHGHALRGLYNKHIAIARNEGHEQENVQVLAPGSKEISRLQISQWYKRPFMMDAWAQVDGRISTNGTAQHRFQDASARARSKGPSVLASLEKSANIRTTENSGG